MIGIYKITNTINNKCYIGQSIDIESRWKQHIFNGKNLYYKTKFYLALNKYGANAFTFEVLEECPAKQEILNEREHYWIEYYDSFNNGYNSTLGGQSIGNQKYDLQAIRDLWNEGYSVGEIAEIIGCSRDTVRMHLKEYSGYNVHTSHSRGKLHAMMEGAQFGFASMAVYQYNLNGQYIAEYESISEAARKLGHNNPDTIRAVLNHKCQTAYGYQWSREKVESMPMIPAPHGGRLVRCVNTGKIFYSSSEAARWCNLKSRSHIVECCVGKQKTAGRHPETGERLEWEFAE